jgi:hypothetical protein
MADAPDFTKMVPGFDFLQDLVKNAGAALPGIGQWVAPTINPEEIGKRIDELRTVQFWLEQNAKMLGATIQAMEVQRMTLSTLKTMNVSMADLRDSLTLKTPAAAPAAPAAKAAAPEPKPAAPEAKSSDAASPAALPGVVDPMQWWGALTKQFTEVAANAMKDGAHDAARQLGTALVQQSIDTASAGFKKAAEIPLAAAAAVAAKPRKAPAGATASAPAPRAPARRAAAQPASAAAKRKR